jgi:hypothetical protein
MKSLQEIRIDVVRMGKEIRVNPSFEDSFKKLLEFLGITDFKLEDSELNAIDNNNFEKSILKVAICKSLGISIYGNNNPWYNSFVITRNEDSFGYHGSSVDKSRVSYDLSLCSVITYELYNLLTLSEDQLEFLKTFKDRYQVLKEKLEDIQKNCFPITVEE